MSWYRVLMVGVATESRMVEAESRDEAIDAAFDGQGDLEYTDTTDLEFSECELVDGEED